MAEILAFGTRRTNAEAIADCHALGYIQEMDAVLDLTYRNGTFWADYCPVNLTTNDLDPRYGDHHHDFRCTPWDDNQFDVVVFDPPYKLNGTSTGDGPSAADDRYGVADGYMSVKAKHALMIAGMAESCRLSNRVVLAKCQDQVASGRKHWQTDILSSVVTSLGLRRVDMLHVQGYRKQSGRQVHARGDYSTLLVFRRGNT